jgi:hypothetical protein
MLSRPWGPAGNAATSPGSIDSGIARAALGAFARSSFGRGSSAWTDFSLASRLLLGLDAPVLFIKPLEGGDLTGAANPAHPGLSQISIAIDDPNSVIAEAYRDNVETRFQASPRPPGRCAADWQFARWLASDGLLCVPWNNGLESGVAVFPCPSNENAGDETTTTCASSSPMPPRYASPSATPKSACVSEVEENRRPPLCRPRPAHRPRGQQPADRHQDLPGHHRREGRRRHPQGAAQPSQRRTRPGWRSDPQDQRLHRHLPAGPAHSGVAEILHDLRALYGEALFARRGIHFELRTSANLPAAAIPPDALKQVLLNLFKNAAEAIPEGGKLTVSAVAGINANGSPCLEIRVVDNGPGLPPERIADPVRRGAAATAPSPAAGRGPAGGARPRHRLTAVPSCAAASLGSGTLFQIFMPLAAMP